MQKIFLLILCFGTTHLLPEVSEPCTEQVVPSDIEHPLMEEKDDFGLKLPRRLSWDLEMPEPKKAITAEEISQNESESKRNLAEEEDHFPYVGVSYKIDNPPYEETFIVPYVVKEKPPSSTGMGGPTKKSNHVFIKGKSSGRKRRNLLDKHSLVTSNFSRSQLRNIQHLI